MTITARCWGGPCEGRIVSSPYHTVRFPVLMPGFVMDMYGYRAERVCVLLAGSRPIPPDDGITIVTHESLVTGERMTQMVGRCWVAVDALPEIKQRILAGLNIVLFLAGAMR